MENINIFNSIIVPIISMGITGIWVWFINRDKTDNGYLNKIIAVLKNTKKFKI
jgi:hypothetical protein